MKAVRHYLLLLVLSLACPDFRLLEGEELCLTVCFLQGHCDHRPEALKRQAKKKTFFSCKQIPSRCFALPQEADKDSISPEGNGILPHTTSHKLGKPRDNFHNSKMSKNERVQCNDHPLSLSSLRVPIRPLGTVTSLMALVL